MITERIKIEIKKHKNLAYQAFLEKNKEEQKMQDIIVKVLEQILNG